MTAPHFQEFFDGSEYAPTHVSHDSRSVCGTLLGSDWCAPSEAGDDDSAEPPLILDRDTELFALDARTLGAESFMILDGSASDSSYVALDAPVSPYTAADEYTTGSEDPYASWYKYHIRVFQRFPTLSSPGKKVGHTPKKNTFSFFFPRINSPDG